MATTEVGIKIGVTGDAQARRAFASVEESADSLAASVRTVGQLGASLLALGGVSQTVGAFVRTADAVTNLQNQLKLATGSANAAAQAYQQLFTIAQASRVSFVELGNTYASISRAGADLGVSQQRLLTVTEAIGNAMTISGGNAQGMQAALVQLSQGLASGTLRGEELNSVMEQAPRLAKALADGLGVTTGELRAMGAAGQITAQQVIKALESQAKVLREEVAGATLTVGQAMTQMGNAAVNAVAHVDNLTGASRSLAMALSSVASNIGNVGIAFERLPKDASPLARMFPGLSLLATGVAARQTVGQSQQNNASYDAVENARLARGTEEMRAREQAQARLNTVLGAASGVSDRYRAAVVQLNADLDAGLITGQQFAQGIEAAQKAYLKAAPAAKAAGDAEKARRDLIMQRYELAMTVAEFEESVRKNEEQALRRTLDAQEAIRLSAMETGRAEVVEAERAAAAAQLELQGVGKLKSEIYSLQLVRLEEARDAAALAGEDVSNIERRIDATRRLRDAQRGMEAKEASDTAAKEAQKAAEAAAKEWERTAQAIENSLVDSLMRGFESGKDFARNLRDTVVNMFKTMVLRPVVQAIVSPLAGAVTGALGMSAGSAFATSAAGGAAGSAFATSAAGGAAGSALSGGVLGSSLAYVTGALNTFGNAALASVQSLLGLTNTGAQLATLGANVASASGLASTGTGLLTQAGSLVGPLAIIGGLAYLANATKGETRVGGQFGVAFDGAVVNQRRGQTYTIQGQQYDRNFTGGQSIALINGQAYRMEGDPVENEQAIRAAVAAAASTINGLLQTFGSTATLTGFSAGLETSGKGRGGVFAGGILSSGVRFGESGQGDNYAGTLYELGSTRSPDFATALRDFSLDLQQATIQALQAATDLPNYVKRVVDGVDAEKLGADQVAAMLQQLTQLSSAVAVARDVMGRLRDVTNVTGVALDNVASSLIDAFGGIDQFVSATQSYYMAYYSDAERTADLTRRVSKAMVDLGLTMPGTRAEFRAMVDAQDLTTESGRNTYAALLGLSGAFAELTDTVGNATDSLQGEINRLRGINSTELRTGAEVLGAFSIATAAARAGDAQALASLPSLAQAVERQAQATGRSSLDVLSTRAFLAQSLSDTQAISAGNPTAAPIVAAVEQQGEKQVVAQVQMASLMGRVLKVLERWDTDGQPETRTL